MTEGSLSFKRGLVVVQTRARLKNNEGSAFQCKQRRGSVKAKECTSTFEAIQHLLALRIAQHSVKSYEIGTFLHPFRSFFPFTLLIIHKFEYLCNDYPHIGAIDPEKGLRSVAVGRNELRRMQINKIIISWKHLKVFWLLS